MRLKGGSSGSAMELAGALIKRLAGKTCEFAGVQAGGEHFACVRFCTAPKPPLCKGRWHGAAVTEGLCSKH